MKQPLDEERKQRNNIIEINFKQNKISDVVNIFLQNKPIRPGEVFFSPFYE
ncbi:MULTISPECIES: hypothetical protein [Thermoactinomyces]|jgi:hypothetical protein|uniref:Uncharacterized protein n=1 Tax=Thermoactinomyces daqus TaxID=1329516 RepID=A0A7W1XB11_9BACL|nr:MULTISPECIES: hypothetical protein [Thermoactinomyces]MBA4543336.1 hypothetical protein [Thermoactinomyces daqus]MBH8598476.1 hypothetical protein [Thermoactinomyces sp. CICC 10523]MBH8604679.1 hypothetical protein [Thermoactinomyces sp. CICC 10522]MBH8606860.1 hypothetical protein [Thermoactinomyces sp. CICC 10521]